MSRTPVVLLFGLLGCGAPHAVRPDAAAPNLVEADGNASKPRIDHAQVQKVVRSEFGRFRKCYEAGLSRKHDLQGKVTVKFEVDLEGNVISAEDFGSTLPDAEVVRCVVDGYRGLRFPKPTPAEKPLIVVYPIIFNPGE